MLRLCNCGVGERMESASLSEPFDDTAVSTADRIVDPSPSPEKIVLMTELQRVMAKEHRWT